MIYRFWFISNPRQLSICVRSGRVHDAVEVAKGRILDRVSAETFAAMSVFGGDGNIRNGCWSFCGRMFWEIRRGFEWHPQGPLLAAGGFPNLRWIGRTANDQIAAYDRLWRIAK